MNALGAHPELAGVGVAVRRAPFEGRRKAAVVDLRKRERTRECTKRRISGQREDEKVQGDSVKGWEGERG